MKRLLALLLLNLGNLGATGVLYVNREQICKSSHSQTPIVRKDLLFVDDFWTIHSLLRMAAPISVFEIGTSTPEGTLIIKTAIMEKIGEMCYLPYRQMIGNSLSLNSSDFYPIDTWFIDGAHDYPRVFYETKHALLSQPSLIVWHDADILKTFKVIQDDLDQRTDLLFRVNNTRIAFSVPSNSKLMRLIYG